MGTKFELPGMEVRWMTLDKGKPDLDIHDALPRRLTELKLVSRDWLVGSRDPDCACMRSNGGAMAVTSLEA